MARNTVKAAEQPTLEERFSWCAPSFQDKIRKLAGRAGKSWQTVYAMWRDHCAACYDQSALLSEFIEWNKEKLGVDPADAIKFCNA